MAGPGFGNQSSGQRLGITEPISWSGPTEYDMIKTRELEKVIDEFLFIDTQTCMLLVGVIVLLRIIQNR